jgi:uroporphyrinogen-III synthase
MPEGRLQGVGVLVTRPRAQAGELIAAIEQEGGRAIPFPVIEIAPLDTARVAAAAASLPEPDVTIFVSRNAVEHGIGYTGDSRIAVIGPATAEAVEAAGRKVDIQPDGGFDSEHLLGEASLAEVRGKQVRIIRGTSGRGLLAEELAARGADVHYLEVYERRRPQVSDAALDELESQWARGDINYVVAMSVQSFDNLVALLPDASAERFVLTRLVTPADRVIKEVLNRYPESRPILAAGPQARDMVEAIIAHHLSDTGTAQ